MGAKGGDKDWYGYCVDDPVNRVDAWGLWSLFGSGGEECVNPRPVGIFETRNRVLQFSP